MFKFRGRVLKVCPAASEIVKRIESGQWTAVGVLEAYISRASLAHAHTNCLTESEWLDVFIHMILTFLSYVRRRAQACPQFGPGVFFDGKAPRSIARRTDELQGSM